MMTSCTGLLLLLLLGLSRAQSPLEEEGTEEEPQDPAGSITAGIMNSNNATGELLLEGDLLLPKTRNAMRCFSQTCMWKKSPNGKVMVPYVVARAFSRSDKQVIERAMQGYSRTCVQFVPRGGERDYISIENGNGCYSSMGRVGNRQVVSINRRGCMTNGIVQHELNHALGFFHEQTRSDRDNYIRINWQNIAGNMAYNFNKENTNNLGTPYDYSSIMQYERSAFSLGRGRDSMTPVPNANVRLGGSNSMTSTDIQRINNLYCR